MHVLEQRRENLKGLNRERVFSLYLSVILTHYIIIFPRQLICTVVSLFQIKFILRLILFRGQICKIKYSAQLPKLQREGIPSRMTTPWVWTLICCLLNTGEWVIFVREMRQWGKTEMLTLKCSYKSLLFSHQAAMHFLMTKTEN